MTFRKLSIAILLLLTGPFISAQGTYTKAQTDSLWAVWSNPALPDTSRIQALDEYVYAGYHEYVDQHPDSAFYFAQMEYDFAQSKGLKTFMIYALATQVLSWRARGEYAKELEYQLRLLRLTEEFGNKRMVVTALTDLGTFYISMADYLRALDYHERALKILEGIGDSLGIADMFNNIGIIYNRQEDFSKALEYYQRALKFYEENGDTAKMGATLINVAISSASLGDTTRAIDYFQRGLKICEQNGLKHFQANAIGGLAGIYDGQGNTQKALDYFAQAMKMHEEIGAYIPVAMNMNNIGILYFNKKDFKTAIVWCKKGLALAAETGTIYIQKASCDCLYDAYKALGKDKEALVYLEKKGQLDEQLNKEETSKKLQEMEFAKVMKQDSLANADKARLVEEAHQVEVNKKNRTRNMLLGSAFVLLALAGGLFRRWRRVSKSRDQIAKEKDRSENLLLNILPADIAEELKTKGRAEARDFDMVSILFSDFKSFTETSSNLSPQDLVAEINSCFEAFDDIMAKYGIEKIKTVGDAYMAAGGLPVVTEDSVKNTVLAGLEMQEFIMRRKADSDAQGKPAFEMRVGIHTGPVVAGIVGIKKFQYDIWGDTVNLASRMETNSEPGKVNISQSTYELVKDDPDFTFEYRGKIDAKGKGEVDMYFVNIMNP